MKGLVAAVTVALTSIIVGEAALADSYHAVGDWQIRKTTSPFDDSTTVSMELYSSDKIPSRFGKSGSARMYLRCRENTTNAYIVFAGNFMADIRDYGRVRYRLDSDKAVTKNMRASTDNESLGLWSGGVAIPFIKDMLGHQKMVLAATPFNESTYTMTFNVSKLNEAVKPLRAACHW